MRLLLGQTIALVGFDEAALGSELGEALVEGGGSYAAENPQLGEWDGAVDAAEGIGDALVDGTRRWC
jgi:hypothetical protein